ILIGVTPSGRRVTRARVDVGRRLPRVGDRVAALLRAVHGEDAGGDEMHVGERVRSQFLVNRVGAGLGLPRDEARETMGREVAGGEMDAALDVGVEAAAV